jgi:glycogen debranching enzyme
VTDEIIQVEHNFYILATSSRLDEHARVLKHADTFAIVDRAGNIQRVGLGEQGLYHQGTRFLSRLDLRLEGRRPLLLSSSVRDDNAVLTVDLANADYSDQSTVLLARDTVHIGRTSFLWNCARFERLALRSYLLRPVTIRFTLLYEADFADIFEVRGVKRPRRGESLSPRFEAGRVRLAYRGLDDEVRATVIEFHPPPAEIRADRAEFICDLAPGADASFDVVVRCETSSVRCEEVSFDRAAGAALAESRRSSAADAVTYSSNEQFNDWMNRSTADVHLMLTRRPGGPYPYAGVPWFSTYFGRDGIITALEYLWVNPEPARGVLSYLAATQATEIDPVRDAEPGKILHESRQGEMAALGEIPFGRYYGSVDATPLFIMLAGAYYARTADRDFIATLWPHIRAALDWIDQYADTNGDGLVEYVKRSPKGLVVQGWKDSVDSVFHADGELAEGPVALCEVQGYVYAAKHAAANLARVLGQPARVASDLLAQAERLRTRFEEAFWCEDLGTYALALDGRGRACRVRASNAGHGLFTGIVSPARARRTADTLLDETSFSGWGIRTVASDEVRYNPMSYHNGSVWPHDNAMIAAGLARYGLMAHARRVFSALFDISLFVALHRMPELICGFGRRAGEAPTLYPVACAPQSWAAAAAPSLLQSLLGLSIDAPRRQVRFDRPVLPESLQLLRIRNLRVADATIDLELRRVHEDVGVDLVRRDGDVEVLISK